MPVHLSSGNKGGDRGPHLWLFSDHPHPGNYLFRKQNLQDEIRKITLLFLSLPRPIKETGGLEFLRRLQVIFWKRVDSVNPLDIW